MERAIHTSASVKSILYSNKRSEMQVNEWYFINELHLGVVQHYSQYLTADNSSQERQF